MFRSLVSDSLFFIFEVLGLKPTASRMLGKHTTAELRHSSQVLSG